MKASLLALALAACGPSDVARRPLREEWPGGGLKCEGSEVRVGGRWVKDGPATFHRQDGSLAARGGYERGLESGAWSEWLEDGTRAEGAYLEGRREGPWVYWHPEGTRQEEGAYAAGNHQGLRAGLLKRTFAFDDQRFDYRVLKGARHVGPQRVVNLQPAHRDNHGGFQTAKTEIRSPVRDLGFGELHGFSVAVERQPIDHRPTGILQSHHLGDLIKRLAGRVVACP